MKIPRLFGLVFMAYSLLWPMITFCQYVENVVSNATVDQTGKARYSIVYDLIAPYQNIPCVIKVKIITEDDKSFYLKELSGDVGNLIYPGTKKLITWDYVQELVHFSGEINLSVEATPSIKVPVKQKRSKPLPVEMAPIYQAKKNYAIKLFREGKEVSRLNDVLLIENTFPVQLPKKTKLKGKYQLALTDGDNTYFSNTFKVKPKIGRGWFVLPLLAVPGYIFVNQYIEENKPLPGPPTN